MIGGGPIYSLEMLRSTALVLFNGAVGVRGDGDGDGVGDVGGRVVDLDDLLGAIAKDCHGLF